MFGIFAGIASGAPEILFSEESFARGVSYPIGNTNPQFGSGLALVDLDSDGDLDIISTGAGGGIVGLFENDGAGYFTPRVAGSGINPINTSGVAVGDYDNDGDLDIFLSGWLVPSKLYRNEGDFSFTDVSAGAGISITVPGMGAAWSDFDRDGTLDLYASCRTGTNNNFSPNSMFVNKGDGTFDESAAVLGITSENFPTLLAAFFDFDRDGDDDLYLGTDKGNDADWWNRLYQNNGAGPFTEITDLADARANIDCMGIAVGDINFDGLFDVYMTDLFRNQLRIQDGNGVLVDMTDAAGMTSGTFNWATVFADFNNDSYLDTYVCSTNSANRLYKGEPMADWPVDEVAVDAGVDHPSASYCVATGDIDGDGAIDMIVGEVPGFLRIYMNQTKTAQTNNWVRFRVAPGAGLAGNGIGTCVDLYDGEKWQARQVRNGVNYKASEGDGVHFGLAGVTEVPTVSVVWPGNEIRALSGAPANRTWTLYRSSRLGDVDGDGVIDKREIMQAVQAMTGPGVKIEPGVEIFDMDGDFDIDPDDIAEMGIRYIDPSRLGTFQR